jgi:hypothetical protein
MGAAMRTLSMLPAHSERGEFFASVYVVGYLAFSVPAIIAGIFVTHAGLVETTVGYEVAIGLLALGRRGQRAPPGAAGRQRACGGTGRRGSGTGRRRQRTAG